jgi:hypothetical protein
LADIVIVPSVRTESESYNRLPYLWYEVLLAEPTVVFNFDQCVDLTAEAVAFLGGLVRWAQSQNKEVQFQLGTLNRALYSRLAQIGLLDALGLDRRRWRKTTIPFREDSRKNEDSIINYLNLIWSSDRALVPSRQVRQLIVGYLWELYDNAFEHGHSRVGVIACGDHFPKQNLLTITVLDFGEGIPNQVRLFLNAPDLAPELALKWAFRPGKSTKRENIKRGLGLNIVSELVTKTQGKLRIFSHDGFAEIDSTSQRFAARSLYFEGTMITLSLRPEMLSRVVQLNLF